MATPKSVVGTVRPQTVAKVLEFCKDIYVCSPELVAGKDRKTTALVAKYGISAGIPPMLRDEGILSEKIENGVAIRTWSNGEPTEELVTRWMIKYNKKSWERNLQRQGMDAKQPDKNSGAEMGITEGAHYVRIENQDVSRTINDMSYLMAVGIKYDVAMDKIPGFCKEIMEHFMLKK